MTKYSSIMDSHGKGSSTIEFLETEVKMLELAWDTLHDFKQQLENFHIVTGRNLDDEYREKVKIERKNPIDKTNNASTVTEYLFPRDMFDGVYRGTFTKRISWRTNVS